MTFRLLMRVTAIGLTMATAVIMASAQPSQEVVTRFKEQTTECRKYVQEVKEYPQAENLCKAALETSEKLPAVKKTERLQARENYGLVFYFREEYESAAENFLKALDAGKSLPSSSPALGNLFFNLARTYHKLNDTKKASSYYVLAESTYRKAAAAAESKALRQEYLDTALILKVLIKAVS